MRTCLVFKSSILEKLKPHLENFVKGTVPLDMTEYHGRTPLHWAASAPNLDAASILISEQRELVNAQDQNGRTALHRAIKWASEVDSSQNSLRNAYREMIKKLIANSVTVTDTIDNQNRTAWSYAGDKDRKWAKDLKALRNEAHLVEGLSKSGQAKSDNISNLTADQQQSVQELKALLYEIYLGDDKDLFLDCMMPVEKSIFDLVYGPKKGLEGIFSGIRPTGRAAKCRWIHLPANNAS